jgi:ribosome-associated heat shock protein Hsp15
MPTLCSFMPGNLIRFGRAVQRSREPEIVPIPLFPWLEEKGQLWYLNILGQRSRRSVMAEHSAEERVRIDKWLWAARFFKTRAQAAQAVAGGLVHVNGQRVKPARQLGIGDQLSITRGQETFLVQVIGLAERRGPASRAQQLYEESEESLRAREAGRRERRLLGVAPGPSTAGRPGKRDRRLIRRFVRGESRE